MKFALLIVQTDASRRAIVEDRVAHRLAIEDWMTAQARAGTLIGGEAFEGADTAVTVRHNGDQVTVTEGPFTDGRETVGGYVLVDVPDRDGAVELAASWPTQETIEVQPVWTPT